MRFKDKVVVITGGGSGMGLAASKLFAAEGAIVAVNDVKAETAERTVAAIKAAGGRALAIPGDVASKEVAQACVAETIERHGRIDVLVNNAGIATIQPAEAYTEWDRIIGVDLNAPFYWSQAAAAQSMIANKAGAIVNISSLAGLVAYPGDVGYIAAKAGVLGLTRSLAVEWAKYNIRVNCVCPGFTDTQIIKDMEAIDPNRFAERRRRIPMQRAAQPEEMAKAMAFLASDDASYITGATLNVDGGQIALSSGWSPG
ncbi:SDR family NAD(P)-dependent oxidoreductase [Kumtagia ephedrae]|uniref:NAD(P)-dependent oxidoreductase n=1 Tax=Kumtagia ephedrae TaxID=2116701 RepID=A0A2P7SS09_9HYPH|nr:SDR family NAD(P)-dependent oxidoreductase [Mesorhizobium ephedrae]PSJ65259.1 NAD(P)-dependent oxidoreductase [Mesorhizobium ephedrae]